MDDSTPADGPAAPADAEYQALLGRIRAAIEQTIPRDTIAVVFSRGDQALVHALDRDLWHFPRLADGRYAGFYPRDDAEATLHLRQVMLGGAGAIVVPRTSFWWADTYPGLFAEIERQFTLVHDDPATCRVYRRRPRSDRPPPRGVPNARLARAVDTLLGGLHGAEDRAYVRRLIAYLLTFEAISEPDQDEVTLWEQLGLHVVPADFSSPIPLVGQADRERTWDRQYSLDGVDLQDKRQLALLARLAALWQAPEHQPYWEAVRSIASRPENVMLMHVDALVYAAMLLDARPGTIVEVGAGYSTLIALAYAQHVQAAEIVCIDPRPPRFLAQSAPSQVTLLQQPVQAVAIDLFRGLGPGDVLFFDGSHVARMDSDVHQLFFAILPNLAAGVLVQLHDIFLPGEYPRHLLVPRRQFWNEQYLLYAFLQYNAAFEVVLANAALHHRHPGRLSAAFGGAPEEAGGSFWLRRRPDPSA